MPDFPSSDLKAAMGGPWRAGDFGAIARTMGVPGAEHFVARTAFEPGALVLDIACGTGNVAIPFARRGAKVTGLDMMPHLLDAARARATHEGLQIRFDEGFAETLPYPDASFDIVVSMFGIMFSPFPEITTSEMARVLKPGGRLLLANWTKSGFSGRMAAAAGRHLPPVPPAAASPFLWGDGATIRDRLRPGFDEIETSAVAVDWDLDMSAIDAAAFFARNAGSLQLSLERLDPSNRAALLADLEQLWLDSNLSTGDASHTQIANEYLHVAAKRRCRVG